MRAPATLWLLFLLLVGLQRAQADLRWREQQQTHSGARSLAQAGAPQPATQPTTVPANVTQLERAAETRRIYMAVTRERDATAAAAANPEAAWQQWTAVWQVTYASSAQEAAAKGNFLLNVDKAAKLNAAAGPEVAFGLTRFADLSPEDFLAQFTGDAQDDSGLTVTPASPQLQKLPASDVLAALSTSTMFAPAPASTEGPTFVTTRPGPAGPAGTQVPAPRGAGPGAVIGPTSPVGRSQPFEARPAGPSSMQQTIGGRARVLEVGRPAAARGLLAQQSQVPASGPGALLPQLAALVRRCWQWLAGSISSEPDSGGQQWLDEARQAELDAELAARGDEDSSGADGSGWAPLLASGRSLQQLTQPGVSLAPPPPTLPPASRRFNGDPYCSRQQPFRLAKLEPFASVDWLRAGIVRPVRDQGNCSNSFAFVAAALAETTMSIQGYKGPTVDISEAQLMACLPHADCSRAGATHVLLNELACDGFAAAAGSWTPPPPGKPPVCDGSSGSDKLGPAPTKGGPVETGISGWSFVPPTELAFAQALTRTPIKVSVDAALLQLYRAGFVPCNARASLANHAMLAVGYSTRVVPIPGSAGAAADGSLTFRNGSEYWMLRNSWGLAGSVDGYVYLSKGCPAAAPLALLANRGVMPLWNQSEAVSVGQLRCAADPGAPLPPGCSRETLAYLASLCAGVGEFLPLSDPTSPARQSRGNCSCSCLPDQQSNGVVDPDTVAVTSPAAPGLAPPVISGPSSGGGGGGGAEGGLPPGGLSAPIVRPPADAAAGTGAGAGAGTAAGPAGTAAPVVLPATPIALTPDPGVTPTGAAVAPGS